MNPTIGHGDADADPFGERSACRLSVSKQILGGQFHFTSSSQALLDLVEAAFGGLPWQRSWAATPGFHIELRLVPGGASPHAGELPPMQTQSGAGLLCGVMDELNYMVLAPAQRRALVVVSEDMLDRSCDLRHELIEFAVLTLAARGMGLIPLHGACVGSRGRGLLLLGESGAGKSTLALQGMLQGLDLLAEDAVFVQPESFIATGVASYLHVRNDALCFVDDEETRRWIRAAPIIRRRNGVEKFEVDLRRSNRRLANPLQVVGAVFISGQPAGASGGLLEPVPREHVAARLSAVQPYAANQPGWHRFEQQVMRMEVHELRRSRHPRASIDALRRLLA